MKINWKVRLRHPAFYAAMTALLGFILVDLQVIESGKYEMYVQLVLGVLTAGGVIVDFTTPALRDSQLSLEKEKPVDGEDMSSHDNLH